MIVQTTFFECEALKLLGMNVNDLFTHIKIQCICENGAIHLLRVYLR
jgi:hypothetical protein